MLCWKKRCKNARAENVSVCFQQMDMTCLDLEWPVVAVVATCDPVNYLSPLQVPLFFTSAYEQLPHNGLLLFDVSTPYHYQEEIGCDSYCQLEEDAAYILQTEADDSVCTMELTLLPNEGVGCTHGQQSAIRYICMLWKRWKERCITWDSIWCMCMALVPRISRRPIVADGSLLPRKLNGNKEIIHMIIEVQDQLRHYSLENGEASCRSADGQRVP